MAPAHGDFFIPFVTDLGRPEQRETQPPPRGFRVALVNMPLASAGTPSIQLGLLHSVLRSEGFAVDSHHLNLNLAAVLSPAVYEEFARHARMTAEWTFSVSAFGEAARDDEAYFAAFPEQLAWLDDLKKDKSFLVALRRQIAPDFIESCLRDVDWSRYSVIGFTSTFEQTVASLALARRIKTIHPAVRIVLGGANVDGEMGKGHAEAFPFIDYVVVGEGELAFPRLLRQLAGCEPMRPLEGVYRRAGDQVEGYGRAAPVPDLDALPVPDYTDYFERARGLGLLNDPAFERALPFQSSRGCWWGQKSQCTFCGLNGQSLAYRRKSAGAVLRELDALSANYGSKQFNATDGILDMSYIAELFPALANRRAGYRFSYAMKANLTKEQIRALYSGGVRWAQPGIESLSSHVLALMNKGCTMLQNVLMMKWCRYYGISICWNLLHGFPGEAVEDYRSELAVLKLIPHLEPPAICQHIRLARFSPYFCDRANYPVKNVRPEASYYHVYPGGLDLARLCRDFECDWENTLPESAHAETRAWVRQWQERWKSGRWPALFYRRMGDGLTVEDYRDGCEARQYTLPATHALIYEYCSEAIRAESQVRELAGWSAGDILAELCELGLMLGEEGRYLSLAIPAGTDG